MANNYAIIKDQVVVNTAVAEPQYAKEQGWVELTGGAGIGWSYIDGQFIAPPPQPLPVPVSITMRQARLELLNVGKLDDVDAALAAIQSEQQRKAAQIEWEYATIVERNAPLVQSLTPALGFTESEMDELFQRAALL